jgi:two-component system sensor histidine kinase/response regulator
VLLEVTKTPVGPADGEPIGLLMVLRDITAARTTAVVARTESDLARVITRQASREELLAAILDIALALPGLEGGGIYDRHADGAYGLVHHRGLSLEFIAEVSSVSAEGPQATLLAMGRTAVSFDAPPRFVHAPMLVESPYALREGLRCAVVLPVVVDGVTVACLNLAGRKVDRLSLDVLTALEALHLHFSHALWRLEVERRAALARTNFERLFDTVQDFVFVLDDAGAILHHNRAVNEALGYARGELIGRSIGDVHPADTREELGRLFAEVVANSRQSCRLPLRARDGRVVPVETHAVRGEWDGHAAVLCISRDVTQQREAEQAMLRAKAAADAASAAKSEFLANMSHEIRTPMNAVIGLTQLALDMRLEPEPRAYVGKAHGAAVSLLGVLNDVLDFSKIEARKVEFECIPLSLDEVFARVRGLVELRASEKGLALTVSVAPDLPPGLRGDPLRLAQVLTNLAGNSVKFSDRGAVRVSAARAGRDGERVRVRFEVSDEGVGLDAAQRAMIFEPFTQGDGSMTRRFGGTGLGLAISRQFVAMMGGALDVESEPGRGSCFFFELSFEACEAPDRHWPSAPTAAPPRLVGLEVLVVEDNPLNQLVAMSVLERSKLRPTLARDGAEALHILAERPAAFGAVLMDLQMPVLDGLSATRLIRADRRYDALPIIAVTAHAFAEDRERCLSAGMQDYLSKPFELGRLFRTLETWCRH